MDELENNSQGASPDADPATPEAAIVDLEITGEAAEPAISVEELMGSNEEPTEDQTATASQEDTQLKAILEAIVYVAEEPLTLAQIAASLQQLPNAPIFSLRLMSAASRITLGLRPMTRIRCVRVMGGSVMARPPRSVGVTNIVDVGHTNNPGSVCGWRRTTRQPKLLPG